MPPPKDPQYETPYQIRPPLVFENRDGLDDIKTYFNPNLHSGQQAYAQTKVTPTQQDSLVPAPKDPQYETIPQLHQPLLPENQDQEDDLHHRWNPNKYTNQEAYAQKSKPSNATASLAEPHQNQTAFAVPTNSSSFVVAPPANASAF